MAVAEQAAMDAAAAQAEVQEVRMAGEQFLQQLEEAKAATQVAEAAKQAAEAAKQVAEAAKQVAEAEALAASRQVKWLRGGLDGGS